jgi:predicted molibdopterin-dependent oxidoreductase YjgC
LDIFLDFADRMNLRDADGQKLIGYTDPEGAFDEWRSVSRGCIPDYSGMSYARLAETGGLQWPCTDANPDGTVRLYEDHSFPTRWYVSESFEKDIETGHEHSVQEYREKRDPKGRAVLVATDYEPPLDLTDDAFPLLAISGRQVYHWHTRTKTGKAPALHEAAPSVFVSVSSEDADRLGIADGDSVRIVSRRGAVVVPAKVGGVVSAGVVFIPFHYGELGEDHAANNLMPKMWDPASKQPIQKAAAVRLERLGTTVETGWWQDK